MNIDIDTVNTAVTTDAADVGSSTAVSRTGIVKENDLFTKIFDEMYDKYQKGYMIEEIDQLNAKLALAIPEQELAVTAATMTRTNYTAKATDAVETAVQRAELMADQGTDVIISWYNLGLRTCHKYNII